jgi:hypothetical protein
LAVVGGAVLTIVMASVVAGQGALVMVHTNVLVPTLRFVTPEVGEPGVVTIPVPAVTVHAPVPTAAVLPARVAVVAQTVWSGPALATVGAVELVMFTRSVEAGQGAFVMLHWNVFKPGLKPVTVDVGELGVVTVDVPAVTVHEPVPVITPFPASVAVVPQTA